MRLTKSKPSREVGGWPGNDPYNYPKNDSRSSVGREQAYTAGMQSFPRKLTKSKSFPAQGGSQGSNLHIYPKQETPPKSKDDVRRTNRNRISKSRAEVVVAIMGLTGAGKSSFIQTVTGNRDVGIGHGLNSETTQIVSYMFYDGATKYVLIDTPGFDDSRLSNEDVTKVILEWLESSFHSGTKLNGIVYLHNITKPRMQGSAFKNLRMFRSLCGGDALKNVILATSFWDQVEPRYGEKREQELITSKQFWAEMVAKGSKVMRLERNRATCLAVLREIAKNQRVDLQVQKEMVEQNKSILDTAAGRAAMQDSETAKVEKQMREAREKEKKRMRRLANKQARKAKREKVTLQVDAGWRNVQSTSRRYFDDTCYKCKLWTMQIHHAVQKWELELKKERQERKLPRDPYGYYY